MFLFPVGLMYSLVKLYTGKPGYETDFQAKMEKELVADLIGKYLFNDADFVRSLTVQNRNLFQRLLDELKYLLRITKPGSKEAKQLEKIKKLFEEAYRDAKNTAPTDGVKYNLDNDDVIDLSNNTELAKRVDGVYGAKRYTIIQKYIFEVLGGQSVTLSDGKTAVIDNRDALHIANKSLDKKTAEISNIKEVIEKAQLYAEDTNVDHNKFKYFCYYKTTVKYENETFPIYLNVGLGKYDNKYHLYDITHKIKDTADRINGLERPEGYALRSGVSTHSIDSNFKNVNPKMSLSEDTGAEKADGKNTYSQDVAVEQTETETSEDV